LGQPGPEFETPVALAEQAAGFEFRRGIVFAAINFASRHDVKHAVGDVSVLGAAGVVLEFIVAPTRKSRRAVADVKRPMIRIDDIALELVAPDELPIAVSPAGKPGKQGAYKRENGGAGAGKTR